MIKLNLLRLVSGQLEPAVEVVLALERALWDSHAHPDDVGASSTRKIASDAIPLRLDLLKSGVAYQLGQSGFRFKELAAEGEWVQAIIDLLEVRWQLDDSLAVPAQEFDSVRILSRLFPSRKPADLAYALLRRIRQHYRLRLDDSTGNLIRGLTTRTNILLAKGNSECAEYRRSLHAACHESSTGGVPGEGEHARDRMFFEVLSCAGLLRPVVPNSIAMSGRSIHAETVLSTLFGLHTSIPGFDSLFEGGLLITDSTEPGGTVGIGARTVLVIGEFGTGKSLLSLEMAVEVARKGGIAWVIALEQSLDDCRYALQSIGVSPDDPTFRLVDDPQDASLSLVRTDDRGVILFLGLPPNQKEQADSSDHPSGPDVRSVLDRASRVLPLLRNYPLRMVVLDPINALAKRPPAADLRQRFLSFINEAKQNGVNVWLTCGESEGPEGSEGFEEHVADTVIRLGEERDTHVARRYIEIAKSRLQREQSGRHLFQIVSGGGTEITPKLRGALADRLAPDSGLRQEPLSLGVPGMKKLLRFDALRRGDVIVLEGPTGTSKTLFAAQFLVCADRTGGHSLFFSDFTYEHMHSIVASAAQCGLEDGGPLKPRTEAEISFYRVEFGETHPDIILMRLHEMLEAAVREGHPIDRVLIANPSRWELGVPLLKTDPSFGPSMLSLLRAYGTSVIITCGYSSNISDTPLKSLLMEQADCVFQFSRIRGGRTYRQLVQAVKTREMDHRHGRFQLEVTPTGLRLGNETLYRETKSGVPQAVPVTLFLHSETLIHRRYNERLVGALQTSLSPEARLERQINRFDSAVLRFGPSSAVDEVQILQLDEFQLWPDNTSPLGDRLLYEFGAKDRSELVDGRLLRMKERTRKRQANGNTISEYHFATPFYENISLLAYRKSAFLDKFPGNWRELSEECAKWEQNSPDPDELFFGCQVAHADRFESYNCLLFEILHSLYPFTDEFGGDLCSWFDGAWQKSDSGMPPLGEAVRIFRRLVKRCHDLIFQNNIDSYRRAEQGEDDWEKSQFDVTQRAVVWRHWYNTLNQMLSDMPVRTRVDIEVRPLFGPVHTGASDQRPSYMTTAGEWYLAVPSYSAAPELALDIMEFLTTRERELYRLSLGVGLPTRESFYYSGVDSVDLSASVSPYFEMNMSEVWNLVSDPARVFRRSRLWGYASLAEVLSASLLRILHLPASVSLDRQVDLTIDGMLKKLRFAQTGTAAPGRPAEMTTRQQKS